MKICILQKNNNTFPRVLEYLSRYKTTLDITYNLKASQAKELSRFDVLIFDSLIHIGTHEDVAYIQRLRSQGVVVPILLATQLGEKNSYREAMLDAGVDGCIQENFSHEELYVRLSKLSKKKDRLLFNGTTIETQGTSLDIRNHEVRRKDTIIPLTKTEYNILFHLFLHKNDLVKNNDLEVCLQEDHKKDSLAINIHIFNIRKKMGNNFFIKTIPRYGFSLQDSHVLA